MLKLLKSLNYKQFLQKIHFRCVIGSQFASDTFLTNNKRTISWFFGTVTLAIHPGFYQFKVNNRNTKNTIAKCEMRLK